VTATTTFDGYPEEPALGDLDGDGVMEVLWGGNDGYVWAWHADGSRVTSFPRRVGGAGRNVRIALSDLDGTPGVEIVAAAPSGVVHVLSGDGGELPGWPIGVLAGPVTPAILRSPVSGEPEIVLAAGARVEAWTAGAVRRWSASLPAVVGESPAAGDLDGDGADEIVIPMLASSKLAVFDAEGNPRTGDWDLGGLPNGPPVIGPIRPQADFPPSGNGVGIVVGGANQAHFVAFTGDGAVAIGYPKPGRCGFEPTLAEIDADGRTEIVAGAGGDSTIYFYDAGRDSWNAGAQDWTTTRANLARTGSRLYSPPAPMYDDAAPDRVTDLRAPTVGAESLTLCWTAPTDPGPYGGAAEYDLRRADAPVDERNFEQAVRIPGLAAPSPAGGTDSARVQGLVEDHAYWFGLRSRDRAGNWSGVSAPFSVTTAGFRPAAVRDLRVRVSSDTMLALAWTATGDDGGRGRPATYWLRGGPLSQDPPSFDDAPIRIDHPATADAGGLEGAVVGGLTRARRYWFELKAVDDEGNVSDASNLITSFTGPIGAKVGVALAAGAQPARAPVDIFWQGASGASSRPQSVRIYDLSGRLRRTLPLPPVVEGVATWDGRDESGQVSPAGLYFAQLSSGGFRAVARIALLR
jgi:chitodextrinase